VLLRSPKKAAASELEDLLCKASSEWRLGVSFCLKDGSSGPEANGECAVSLGKGEGPGIVLYDEVRVAAGSQAGPGLLGSKPDLRGVLDVLLLCRPGCWLEDLPKGPRRSSSDKGVEGPEFAAEDGFVLKLGFPALPRMLSQALDTFALMWAVLFGACCLVGGGWKLVKRLAPDDALLGLEGLEVYGLGF